MCTVTQEQVERWQQEYEARIKDEYLKDTEAFTDAVAKLGFVYIGIEHARWKREQDQRIAEVRELLQQPRLRIKEKGPTPSGAEPCNCIEGMNCPHAG